MGTERCHAPPAELPSESTSWCLNAVIARLEDLNHDDECSTEKPVDPAAILALITRILESGTDLVELIASSWK